MAVSEEDQVKGMLEAMGVSSTEDVVSSLSLGPKDEETKPEAAGSAETPAAAAAERRASAGGMGREMSLSTLVHLMGLPSASQVSLLETKIDMLTSKVGQMMLKLDRIATDIGLMKSDATVDRIDFQLTDIRALLKRMPTGGAEVEKPEAVAKAPSSKAKILTSEPAAEKKEEGKQTKIIQQDNLEEFNSPDDAAFQASEGNRVRLETK